MWNVANLRLDEVNFLNPINTPRHAILAQTSSISDLNRPLSSIHDERELLYFRGQICVIRNIPLTASLFQKPVLRDVSPGDKTIDLQQRRNFCGETYNALDQISDALGWYFRPRQQILMKEVDDHIIVGSVEFAGNSEASWVDVEFEPSGLKPLASEIIYGKTMEWDLEVRSDHLTKMEVPTVKSVGWEDADLSPEENANMIVGAMEQVADQLPTQGAYSDFLQETSYPSLYRAAEAVSLILEGKHHAARELAEAILRGEVSRSGLVAEQEILNWLDSVPPLRE